MLNKTTIYTYDINGNIVERCEYAYTTKDGEELSELSCAHYGYDYDGDKLVNYNGADISYNVLGNPTNYRGNAITWQYGKRLTGYGSTTYAYDGQGRRISKSNITFTYDSNGNLLKQSNGLEFIYDNSGVIGVKYSDNTYFYRRDAQGNIIALLDNNGSAVVKYVYDAWGNHVVYNSAGAQNSDATFIGNVNPFRYRGYYYDIETGLYYLQTRYYDPVVCRFISRDSIEYADPETINGINLYAYCGNNPVMHSDPYGTTEWWQWLLFGIGVAVLVVAGGVLAVASLGVGTAAFGATFLGSMALNASVGALIGAGVGSVIGIVSGAIYAGITGADMGQSILDGFLMGFGIGAIAGAAIGGIYGAATFAPNPMIGQTVKLGQVAANQGGKITGWGIHGAQRMAERGISKSLAKLTVKFGTSIIQNNGKIAYITQKAFIVLNSAGTVVTIYGQKYFDAGMQALIKLLFGG